MIILIRYYMNTLYKSAGFVALLEILGFTGDLTRYGPNMFFMFFFNFNMNENMINDI